MVNLVNGEQTITKQVGEQKLPARKPEGQWGQLPEPPQVLEPQEQREQVKGMGMGPGIAGPHQGQPTPQVVGAQGVPRGVQRLEGQRV
jgi:hypothetical protein